MRTIQVSSTAGGGGVLDLGIPGGRAGGGGGGGGGVRPRRAGSDGFLNLRIPVDRAGAEYEVVVVLQPKTAEAGAPIQPAPTAAELLKLPPDQRDAILARQAAVAETYYRNDPELTAFEAFG